MKNWMYQWNAMRLIRLAMGVFIIFQGIESNQWLFVLLGGVFSLMPLLNIGCCSTAGCATNCFLSKKDNSKETTFTEIK